jgi:antitoxin ParD1/3/4
MEISINERNQEWLKQQVDSGKYPSADAVLEEARRVLEERDQALAEELADIHEKVRIGTAQADAGQLIPADEVFAELRRRNAERFQ